MEEKKIDITEPLTEQPSGTEQPLSKERQLELENERLKEENERLRLLEEYRNSLPLKERMYDKIHVSLKTMDRIIFGLVALLVFFFVMGLLNR